MLPRVPKGSTLSLPVALITLVLASGLSSLSFVACQSEDIVDQDAVEGPECSVYETCSDCLGAEDLKCGWCILENKCSLRSDCAVIPNNPLHWILFRGGQCPAITNVTPNQVQRATAKTLQLTIENLPRLSGRFRCVFSVLDKTLITDATRESYGVSCPTPTTDLIPLIPDTQHHLTAKLSVRRTIGPDLVATDFTFLDCNSYSSCSQCAASSYPCDWCVYGTKCTHDTSENCNDDTFVTGSNTTEPNHRKGAQFCPRISQENSEQILIPSGGSKAIKVKVSTLRVYMMQTRFLCRFNIEGRVVTVNAQLLANNIYCDQVQFSYTSTAPNITVPFAVLWAGGSKLLDNPGNVHVVVYQCKNMAENCGTCKDLDQKYSCGWCQSSNTCEINDQCDGPTGSWIGRNQWCPN